MSLQINKAINTDSGFAVPSGAYVWLYMELGLELQYKIKVKLFFYKSKADFDAKRSPFVPVSSDVPPSKQSYEVLLDVNDFAAQTAVTIHNYVKAQLVAQLEPGNNNVVTIVA